MTRILSIILLTGIFLLGCSKIHEPWVEENRLVQERNRTPDQVMTLKHRFMRVQTDR